MRKLKMSLSLLGSISSTCLRAAYMPTDPESTKSCHFCALGSARVKAAHKMLVKLTLVYFEIWVAKQYGDDDD